MRRCVYSRFFYWHLIRLQVIIQGIVAAHEEATRANLEFLQLKANLVHAERVQREQNAEHLALDRAWKEGTIISFPLTLVTNSRSADAEYQTAKTECKRLLDISKDAVNQTDSVTRDKFNVLESARVVWENACKTAREEGNPEPPPGEGVDTRGVEELRAELDTARAKLELNMNTDDGIVIQYERRQEEVGFFIILMNFSLTTTFKIAQLERTIAGDKATEARLQKKIDSARVCWQSLSPKLALTDYRKTGSLPSTVLSKASARSSLPPLLASVAQARFELPNMKTTTNGRSNSSSSSERARGCSYSLLIANLEANAH